METVFLPESWKSWQIRKMLGEGSYGAVYLAEKTLGSDKSTSAIKIIQICPDDNEIQVLTLELGNSESVRKYYEDAVQTCIQEIKAMVALKGHPNIVYIEDYAVEEDPESMRWTIYIRMEYLTPFPEYMQTHTLSESDVIRLGTDLCSALSACEKNGILHRDIKPSNIFISPATGLFKLGDFGISRKMDRSSGVYSSKGTFPYMAPEVFSGRPYDQRSDLYSLGLVLYHLLNRSREPFVDLNKQMVYMKDRENATNRRIAGETIPPPVDASPAMSDVILKVCSFSPEKRYPNADAFKAALESLHSSSKQNGRHKNNIFIWGLSFIVLLTAIFVLFWINTKRNNIHAATSTEAPAPLSTNSITTVFNSPVLTTEIEATIPSDTQANLSTAAETITTPEPIDTPIPNEVDLLSPTENISQIIEVDISNTRLIPIMENDRLYFNSQTQSCVLIPIRSILQLLEDAGSSLTGAEQEFIRTNLKKQFIPEGNDKITNGAKFKEGETITLVYHPDESFNAFLREKGLHLIYNDQTFVAQKDASGNRLRFVYESPK